MVNPAPHFCQNLNETVCSLGYESDENMPMPILSRAMRTDARAATQCQRKRLHFSQNNGIRGHRLYLPYALPAQEVEGADYTKDRLTCKPNRDQWVAVEPR
eukprot:4693615-Amphidinium_carterae.2